MSDAILQMLVNGNNDLKWFDSNLNKLKEEYDKKFIAILNKSVIESDNKLDDLLRKLKEKNIDISNVLIKFVSRINIIL